MPKTTRGDSAPLAIGIVKSLFPAGSFFYLREIGFGRVEASLPGPSIADGIPGMNLPLALAKPFGIGAAAHG